MKFPALRRLWPIFAFMTVLVLAVPATQAQSLSPLIVSFSSTTVGTTSAAKTVTLSNSSSNALKITSITVSGDFTQTNNCGSSVAGRSSCAISVSFKPSAAGSRTGLLTVRDGSGFFGTQLSILAGTGVAVTLTSVTITPANPSVTKGSTQQFTATGTYSNGTTANVTSSATWSSSKTTVATLSTATKGLATAVAAGTSTISATVGSGSAAKTGSTVLSVPAATLLSIAVTPNGVSLGLNGTQQFTATGTYSDGSVQNITNAVTWTSVTPATVSVNATGLAQVVLANDTAVAITAASGTIVSPPAYVSALSALPIVCSTPTIDMKLLVVTSGQTEADFPAITQILDYMGTPYTVLDFVAQPGGVTPAMLSDGSCHGYYQGVIFATGGYIYTLPGMAALTAYEQTFGVRQVNWYTDPTPDFGLNFTSNTLSTTATSTYNANFSSAAAPIFSYANTATPVTISNAFIYLTTPVPSASLPTGASVTPLLTDSSGNALSAIYSFGDGRQYLTQTFDSNQYLTHDLVLAYGLVNWVTKGIFLGQHHVYASGQVDDFFINDSEWIPGTPCTDPITHDRTPPDSSTLPVFRLTSTDMTSLVSWQNSLQTDPQLAGFKLTLAFNGVGTAGNPDWTSVSKAGRASDTLLTSLASYQSVFHWISHTYDHPATLNGLHKSDVGGDTDTPQVDDIDLEILTNMYVANGTGKNLDTDPSDTVSPAGVVPLKFTDFNPANLVSPGVTGLNDTLVPSYLYADGIRYVVSDTSVIGQPNNGPNPSPNVGIVNSYATGIYEVPRYPNDIYYNAANWADDQAEFSCIYNNPVDPPFNTYNAAQILDFVSSSFVVNMLKGDMDPEMFHQPDLHFSNNAPALGLTGTHTSSLISDTYNQTFSKYKALYKLPVLSPTLDQTAVAMQARNAYNLSGVTASLVGFGGPTPTITITAPAGAANIPVTGLNSTGAESYGGQFISHIPVNAGQTVDVPIAGATVVNLASYYNVYGIGTVGTAPISGGFDNDSYTFNSALLGPSANYQNLTFAFGPANAKDAVSSVTVPVTPAAYGKLYLLGAAVNGAQANQSIVVTYTDGTTSTFTQTFSDWAIPASYPGESVVAANASRIGPTGAAATPAVDIYGYTFALAAGKTPVSVKLPSNRNVVFVGIGWGN
jgi:Bacterial Ig-like domain (group 2)/Abnormal spindle-like microcephaly-assoc'd, ASPM-SPD-2-Hydin